jgi:hypothetical protein
MAGVVAIVLLVVLLGLVFLTIERSGRPWLQQRGPWLVGVFVCMAATLIISMYDAELSTPADLMRPRQLREMLITGLVMALLAAEAVLVSRWAVATVRRPAALSYLATFAAGTLLAWLITALAAWAFVPGS